MLILQGWREICAFLRLSKETILKRRFPVHGVGVRGGKVWAFRDDLIKHASLL